MLSILSKHKFVSSITITSLSILIILSLIITFNFSSFYEGYCNGYVPMQTPLETISAWLGDKVYYVLPFWKV
jgi:hypothetical protein